MSKLSSVFKIFGSSILLALLSKNSREDQLSLIREYQRKDADNNSKIIALEKRIKTLEEFASKKSMPLAPFEPSIFHFFLFLVLALVIIGLPIFKNTADYFEYLAYISPALAAFAGGAGIYFSERPATVKLLNWEKSFQVGALLYSISVATICVGLVFFILYKRQSENIAYAMIFPPGLACAVFFAWLRYKKIKRANSRINKIAMSFALLLLFVYLGYTVWWLGLLWNGHIDLIRQIFEKSLSSIGK
ncbi:hypothetical protein [Xanthomonas hortorum]|uniref:hypothetical protein n=1 Tax=Xanthomonas hortorum TaxID=56454 RepID=UPI0015D65CFB|nr:hypothetical protein [Xanthomonas hortorum]MCE4360707.1 hypothetical protein [Xanthomonas hortorum pv. taraxaci]NMI54150.1 hypothetical protein [Xanthomonas hortorum pv. taraxaci]CAD0313556.1 hypothetical protein NCPPB940_11860 [Xanthomonas hortorum pv. taraxaci]CAD0313561.1 hypothetical protein NCPPB940_11860 [Xanthomonas hortorum pv. taraxaci]